MSDLDEELLALTGGGVSKLKRKAPAKRSKKKDYSSESEDSYSSSSSSSDSEEEAVKSRGRKKATPAAKPLKKRKVDSDEESDDEYRDEYGPDLYGDEDDRAYLNSLPELEREKILTERHAKRTEAKEQWEIRRLMKEKAQRGKAQSTPDAAATPRKRTLIKISGKASALSDLRKRKKPSLPSSGKKKRASSGSEDEDEDYDDDRNEDRDEDDDYAPKKKGYDSDEDRYRSKEEKQPVEKEEPIKREDLNMVCLRRDLLERKCNEPYFDDMIKDFFVRIGIGTNAGKPVYRVAQIVGVKEYSKRYALGKATTNKYLQLKHGSSVKQFPMETVSNQHLSESEFLKLIQEMERSDIPLPTKKQIEQQTALLKQYENYVYTEDDIKAMIERKKKLMKTPANFAAREKVRLTGLLDAAKSANDEQKIAEITEQLKDLDEKIKEEEGRKKAGSKEDKALLINKKHKEIAHNTRYENTEAAVSDLDPFSRRRTRPANYFRKEDDDDTGAPKAAEKPKEPVKEQPKPPAKLDKLQTLKNRLQKDLSNPESHLRNAHDFDLEDLEAQLNSILPQPEPHATPTEEKKLGNKKVISLEDYKRRRGL